MEDRGGRKDEKNPPYVMLERPRTCRRVATRLLEATFTGKVPPSLFYKKNRGGGTHSSMPDG